MGKGALSGFSGRRGALFVLMREGRGDEVLEEGLEPIEHRRDVGGAVAGIVLLHHRVIGLEAERLGAQLGFLAGDGDDALEGGQEAGPVVLGAQLAPELLGAHAGDDLAAHEIGR